MQSEQTDPLALIQSLSLFQGMSDNTLLHILSECHRRHFEAGDTICYEGDPGSTCHIIVKGQVRVFVTGEDGRELSLRILGWGDIFGEMALYEGLPRSASVEALEETHTLELHRDVLMTCLQRSPKLALRMLQDLSARLRFATEEAEGLASLPVAERLLRRLQQLSEWSGKAVPGGVRVMVPLTQQELASLIGTSRESVNRALVRLRREGKIDLKDGWIDLLDRASPTCANDRSASVRADDTPPPDPS